MLDIRKLTSAILVPLVKTSRKACCSNRRQVAGTYEYRLLFIFSPIFFLFFGGERLLSVSTETEPVWGREKRQVSIDGFGGLMFSSWTV